MAFEGIDGFEPGPADLDSASSVGSGASRGGGLNVGWINWLATDFGLALSLFSVSTLAGGVADTTGFCSFADGDGLDVGLLANEPNEVSVTVRAEAGTFICAGLTWRRDS